MINHQAEKLFRAMALYQPIVRCDKTYHGQEKRAVQSCLAAIDFLIDNEDVDFLQLRKIFIDHERDIKYKQQIDNLKKSICPPQKTQVHNKPKQTKKNK